MANRSNSNEEGTVLISDRVSFSFLFFLLVVVIIDVITSPTTPQTPSLFLVLVVSLSHATQRSATKDAAPGSETAAAARRRRRNHSHGRAQKHRPLLHHLSRDHAVHGALEQPRGEHLSRAGFSRSHANPNHQERSRRSFPLKDPLCLFLSLSSFFSSPTPAPASSVAFLPRSLCQRERCWSGNQRKAN